MVRISLFNFAFYARQNKAQLAETIQADEHVGVNLFGFGQAQQAALCTTGGGAGNIKSSSSYSITWDDEMI